MRFKYLAIIIIIFTALSSLPANGKKPRKDVLEFYVGGSNGISFNVSKIFREGSSIQVDENLSYNIFSINFNFSIPLGFTYYPSGWFGIGVINCVGIAPSFEWVYPSFELAIYEQIKLVTKFGSLEKNTFLLMEYGIGVRGEIYTYTIEPFTETPVQLGKNAFYYGPCLFIGYDKGNKKNIAFTAGGFIDFLFARNSISIDSTGVSGAVNSFNPNFGVEFRIKYMQQWKI